MATALRPLQTAVFGKLVARPALAGKVYAQLPEPAPYPLVQIGSITEFTDDSHSAQGLNALVVIHVWDKAPSNAGVYDLFAEVDAALDRQPLSVAGWSEVQIKHTQHQIIEDPDPEVRHINAQYQVWLTRESA